MRFLRLQALRTSLSKRRKLVVPVLFIGALTIGGILTTQSAVGAANLTSGLCVVDVETASGVNLASSSGRCTITYSNTGSNSFKVPAGVSKINYVVVGGGGGGASCRGGGGGGAGVDFGSDLSVSSETSYSINVGAGGAAAQCNSYGGNGGDSSIGALVKAGGGGGAGAWGVQGRSGNGGTGYTAGGSGGGSGVVGGSAGSGGSGSSRSGTLGGSGTPPGQDDPRSTGGGGGAGAAGNGQNNNSSSAPMEKIGRNSCGVSHRP